MIRFLKSSTDILIRKRFLAQEFPEIYFMSRSLSTHSNQKIKNSNRTWTKRRVSLPRFGPLTQYAPAPTHHHSSASNTTTAAAWTAETRKKLSLRAAQTKIITQTSLSRRLSRENHLNATCCTIRSAFAKGEKSEKFCVHSEKQKLCRENGRRSGQELVN